MMYNNSTTAGMRGRSSPLLPTPPPPLPLAAFLLLLLLLLIGPSNLASTTTTTTTTTTSYGCHALAATTPGRRSRSSRPDGGGKTRTYNYFAFGSNMASSTMTDLRGLSPLNASAAMLPGHVLRFNVPGLPFVEPSSASVEPAATTAIAAADAEDDEDAAAPGGGRGPVVHGVLYELSESDFGAMCRSEGVPFAYALHRCVVYPYVGDGGSAGEDALLLLRSVAAAAAAAGTDDDAAKRTGGVPAFTLRASRGGWRTGGDTPPSRSYLNVLLRGAGEFAMDKKYVRYLESIRCGKTLFGDGIAGGVLRLAEERNRQRRRQAARAGIGRDPD